jgi:hypothetical protein
LPLPIPCRADSRVGWLRVYSPFPHFNSNTHPRCQHPITLPYLALRKQIPVACLAVPCLALPCLALSAHFPPPRRLHPTNAHTQHALSGIAWPGLA